MKTSAIYYSFFQKNWRTLIIVVGPLFYITVLKPEWTPAPDELTRLLSIPLIDVLVTSMTVYSFTHLLFQVEVALQTS